MRIELTILLLLALNFVSNYELQLTADIIPDRIMTRRSAASEDELLKDRPGPELPSWE